MNCPKCKTEKLDVTSIRGTEVDRCPNCRGVWFDERELQQLLDLAPADLKPLRGGRLHDDLNRLKAKCPRDGSELTRVCSAIKPEVIIDICPNCRGVWVDGGEFDQLIS